MSFINGNLKLNGLFAITSSNINTISGTISNNGTSFIIINPAITATYSNTRVQALQLNPRVIGQYAYTSLSAFTIGDVNTDTSIFSGSFSISTTALLRIHDSTYNSIILSAGSSYNTQIHGANSTRNAGIYGYSGLNLGGSNDTIHMLISSTGSVGIGVTTSLTSLQVAPKSKYSNINTGDGLLIYNPTLTAANIILGVNSHKPNVIQSRDGLSSDWDLHLNPYGGDVLIGYNDLGAYHKFTDRSYQAAGFGIDNGYAGSGYGAIGFNIAFSATTSGVYYHRRNDYMSGIYFGSGGINFFTAPVALGGVTASYSTYLYMNNTGSLLLTGSYFTVSGISYFKNNMLFGSNGEIGTITWGGSGFTLYSGANQALSLGSNNTINRLVIATNGNVGIGTVSPLAKLHISGSLSTANNRLLLDNTEGGSVALYAGITSVSNAGFSILTGGVGGSGLTEKFVISSVGNIGIGTTNPTLGKVQIVGDTNYALHITQGGSLSTNGIILNHSTSGNIRIYSEQTYRSIIGRGTLANLVLYDTGNVSIGSVSDLARLYVISSGTTSATTAFLIQNSASINLIKIKDNGAVVYGNSGFDPFIAPHAPNGGDGINPSLASAHGLLFRTEYSYAAASGYWVFNHPQIITGVNDSASDVVILGGVNTSTLIVTYNSIVSSPTINNTGGTTLVRGFYFNPTLTNTIGTTIRAIETTSGNVIFNGGNVGIGTASPITPLHIYRDNTTSRTSVIDIISIESEANGVGGIGYDGFGTGIVFRGSTYMNPSINRPLSRISSIQRDTSLNDYGNAIVFETIALSSGTASPVERFRIEYNGNIGVGTTAPNGKFEVSGGGNATVGDFLVDTVNNIVYVGRQDSISNNSTFIVRDRLNNFKAYIPSAGVANAYLMGNGGNLGIGLTAPSYKLDVLSGATISARFDGRVIGSNAVNINEFVTLGQLSTGASSSYFLQNGNSFGATAVLGTNDNYGLQFETNNTTALTIGTNGYIGIGIINPTWKLHMSGSMLISNETAMSMGSDAIGGVIRTFGSNLRLADVGGIEYVRFDSANYKVGIGTPTPSEKLEVSGNILISNNNFYKAKSLTSTKYSLVGISSGNIVQIGAIDYTTAGTIFAGGDNSQFTTGGAGGSVRMSIINNGNVGIGTTNPRSVLDVHASTDATFRFAKLSANTGQLLFQDGSNSQINIQYNAYTHQFAYGASEWMRIDQNGNVGIGTASPYSKLDVAGIISINGAYFGNNDTNYTFLYKARSNSIGLFLGGAGDPANYYDNTRHYFRDISTAVMGVFTINGLSIGTNSDPSSSLYIYKNSGDNLIRVNNQSSGSFWSGLSILYQNSEYFSIKGNINSGELRVGGTNASGYFTTIYSNNVETVRVSSDKVSIGSRTNALTTLDVRASSNAAITPLTSVPDTATTMLIGNVGTNGVMAFGYNNNGLGWIQARSVLANQAADGITLNPLGGNVAIGTSSTPLYTLDVSGMIRSTRLIIDATGDNAIHFIRSGGSNDYSIEHDSTRLYFYNRTTTANVFTMLNNNNIGIGTTSPLYRLDVLSGAAISARFDGRVIGVTAVNSNEFITLGQLAASSSNTFVQNGNSFGANAVLGTNDNNALQFETNGVVRLTIAASGNIQFPNGIYLYGGISNSGANIRLDDASHAQMSYGNPATSPTYFRADGGASYVVGTSVIFKNSTTTHLTLNSGVFTFNTLTGSQTDIAILSPAGVLSRTASSTFLAGNYFLQNGNSFGANAVLGTNDNYHLQLKTNNIARITILSSGYIAMGGTHSPLTPLHVSTSATENFYVHPNGAGSGKYGVSIGSRSGGWDFRYGMVSQTGTVSLGGFGFYGTSDAISRYYIGNQFDDAMFNLNSGGLGIGTAATSPDHMITVMKNTSSSSNSVYPAINIDNPNASGYMEYMFTSNAAIKAGIRYINTSNQMYIYTYTGQNDILFGTGGYEQMRLSVSGNLIIGATADTGYKLDVNGTIRGANLVETSSRRYKTNIKNMKSQVHILDKLKPVTFNWKDLNKGTASQYGFIAEEVAKILPDIVSYTADGKADAISYTKLIPMLVQAVQELQYEIEKLKKNI